MLHSHQKHRPHALEIGFGMFGTFRLHPTITSPKALHSIPATWKHDEAFAFAGQRLDARAACSMANSRFFKSLRRLHL